MSEIGKENFINQRSFGRRGKQPTQPIKRFGHRNTGETSIHTVKPRTVPQQILPNTTIQKSEPIIADPIVPVEHAEELRKNITIKKVEGAVLEAKAKSQDLILDMLDISQLIKLSRKDFYTAVNIALNEILSIKSIILNKTELHQLTLLVVDDFLGFGPLEPLLEDPTVNDILVNGPDHVYIERDGLLELTDVKFKDNDHISNIAIRIANRVGRRVDESSPMVDARLEDGSRVNIILPPLALDSPMISIRKFSKNDVTLDMMIQQGNISKEMAHLLVLAVQCRQNILISGGTGSGKTTLLNALSKYIGVNERIITIEDAAELRLQQPHVGRLETRPANLEGNGRITIRDLLRNALRMRPDRIIVGEIRGDEAIDMLQAMNTGHDGSLGTIHANKTRDALTRLENMIEMSGLKGSSRSIRQMISAVDIIVQISRMKDGKRRITNISEITGIEGDIISLADLATFTIDGNNAGTTVNGKFSLSGIRPKFAELAGYYGVEDQLHLIMKNTLD